MDYDFSTTDEPCSIASIALKTVFAVQADNTYDVKKGGAPKVYVAIRTLNGAGSIKIDGLDEITLLPGTILFAWNNEIRRYYCLNNKWDFWWFEFYADDLLQLPANKPLKIDYAENEIADFSSCLKLVRKDDLKSKTLASALLNTIIYKWLLNLDNKSKTSPHNYAIQKSIDYMKSNLNNKISIKAAAEIAGLCERRYRQVFEHITSMQPKKYLEELRINMAVEMLRNTPFSIGEISERLGYSSQFHFSKAFQSRYGMPPSQYRRNILDNIS